jgi:hypothetical protein
VEAVKQKADSENEHQMENGHVLLLNTTPILIIKRYLIHFKVVKVGADQHK